MRRTIGYLFFYGGLIIMILAWTVHNRPPVLVGGHYVKCWVMGGILGLVVTLLGVVITGPTRKR